MILLLVKCNPKLWEISYWMFKCQKLKYAILTILYSLLYGNILLTIEWLESFVCGENNEIYNKIKYLCNLIFCFKVNQCWISYLVCNILQ